MKKTLFLLLLPLWLIAQNSTQNKITFKEGETARFGLNASGLQTISRVEVTFRNTLNTVVRKFSTLDASITLVSDTLYTFAFTDLQSIGKSGRGTWQVEIRSETGVKKTDVYQYEIYKATTTTSSTTPVNGSGYNYLFEWDFTPVTATFSVIHSGLIVVDNVSISDALDLKVDKVTGYGLSQNNYSNAAKGIVDAVTGNLATKLNISDTNTLLRKTTAAGLYVAKVTGKGLSTVDFTTAYETKLNGIASGATANSTDAQLRDRATHTGSQTASTISDFSASVLATPASGLSTASSAAVTNSSTVVQALGQLQKQVWLAVKYATVATAEEAYALTPEPLTVVIIKITSDSINNSGQSSRYELWPDGELWWGAFIRLR